MLKITPKRITFAILFAFSFLIFIQHSLFTWKLHADTYEPFEYQYRLDKWIPILPWIERADFDFHLRLRSPKPIHPGIAIVEINERTIQSVGQFPFSRNEYGKFVKKLESVGAKVLAFDITFPEVERNDALVELKKIQSQWGGNSEFKKILNDRLQTLDGDKNLADILKQTKMPVILGLAFTSIDELGSGLKKVSDRVRQLTRNHTLSTVQVNAFAYGSSRSGKIPIFPHEKLLEAVPRFSLGSFSVVPDADSVIRKSPVVLEFDSGYYPSLSLAAVTRYLGVEPKLYSEDGLWVRDEQNKINIPLNPLGETLVNFYGAERVFPYFEFIDVMNGKYDAELKGKIVFLGVTSVGLKDIRANPYTGDYPGVEAHATLASNMLDQAYLVKDQRYFWSAYFLLIVIGAVVSYTVFRFHPTGALGSTLLIVAAMQLVVQKYFYEKGVVVPTFIPALEFFSLLFSGILYRYFTQEKEKKFVREAFSRYVSGAVVEEILQDKSKLRLGGQKKSLTVLFCDMKGFTKLSEGMDAQFLTQFLNQFFTRMTSIILRNQGTLDKYMGDAIMCFWGAPLELSNHAELACKTALEMMDELKLINSEWKSKYGFEVGIRIGVNTGEMFVGNMGSDQVFSYTVLGDSVNLGSRLEGVNSVYNTSILVSGFTASHTKGFQFRAIDTVQVKGKEEPIEIFELLSPSDKQEEWLYAFEKGRSLYKEKRWEEAEAAFGTCLSLKPKDGPSQIYIERIQDLKKSTPPGWNGIWRLSSK